MNFQQEESKDPKEYSTKFQGPTESKKTSTRNTQSPQLKSLEQHFNKYSTSVERSNSEESCDSEDVFVGTKFLAADTTTKFPPAGAKKYSNSPIQTSASEPKLSLLRSPTKSESSAVRTRRASSQTFDSIQQKRQEKMRRRTTRDPSLYYPNNNHSESISTDNTSSSKGTQGYFLNQASPVPRARGVDATYSYPVSPNESARPTISEFMPADQQYKEFLLSRNNPSSPPRLHHAQNSNPGSFFSQPLNLQLSKFATFFSFIGTILLFLFGFLIEVQPLYIKGISPARTPMHRNLHGHYSTYSFVHFSARLRILQNVTLSNSHTIEEKQEMARMMESMVFEMKDEAKVAFKASALYFLVMVLSYIYTQNYVLIHAQWAKYNVGARVRILVSSIPRNVLLLYRKYKRRHYSNVQDVNSHSRGYHSDGYAPGIGLAKVRITKNTNAMKTPAASYHSDYDSSSGREDFDVGLSLRDRSHRGVSPGGGGSGMNSNTGLGFGSSAWDAMIDKTKKR